MAGSAAAAAATITSFPKFPDFPVEIQLMVWEAFAKAEAASRIVLLHATTGHPPPKNNVEGRFPWLVLGLMPMRRLVSPLLCVCVRSREVALNHYGGTRVDIYEPPPSTTRYGLDMIQPWEQRRQKNEKNEARIEAEYGPRDGRSRIGSSLPGARHCFHPLRAYSQHAWADRDEYAGEVETEIVIRALDHRIWDQEDVTDAQVAANNYMTHRGCVYLHLESDRFLPLCAEPALLVPRYGWLSMIGVGHEPVYGFRELSVALNDFKYNGGPLDHETLEGILERRPAALRYTSLPLSDEVRTGIRHIVFPSYSPPPTPLPGKPWRQTERDHDNIAEAFDIAALNTPGRPLDTPPGEMYPWKSLVQAFPGALGGANEEGPGPSPPSTTTSIWGFRANTEMYRAFFDDLEDKGPEHLRVQKVEKKLPASSSDDELKSWGLVWGSEAWGDDDDKQGQRWLHQQRERRNRCRMMSMSSRRRRGWRLMPGPVNPRRRGRMAYSLFALNPRRK
ncbi:hypothetical protein PG984_002807 [Apiospora sp. TS-2023a]